MLVLVGAPVILPNTQSPANLTMTPAPPGIDAVVYGTEMVCSLTAYFAVSLCLGRPTLALMAFA